MSSTEPQPPFVRHLREAFDRRHGYTLESPILVALSGGADSVALLLALKSAGLEVGVAHLDHTTRDGASTEDAHWVEAFAHSLNVPCFTKQVDVPALAEQSDQSFEEVARHVRYDFLVETAQTQGYTAIATGHHADDQAETVLMRVMRGTSLKGLTGIPGVGAWGGMPIIRPLLTVSRAMIEDYLDGLGQSYREDHTNTDPQYLRNRVRHQLMPLLRDSFNPQVDEALRRLATVAQDEDAVMDTLCNEAYGVCVQGEQINRLVFADTPRAIQRRVLVRLAHSVGAIADFDKIEGALVFVANGASGQRYDWGGGVYLSNGREVTQIVRATEETESPVEVTVPGTVKAFGYVWTFTLLESAPEGSLVDYCSPTRQVVDARALGNRVVLRHRENGDRFQPFGMKGTRKLKDYLNDSGLPIEQRDALVLVTAGDSIVWVAGYAVAQPFVATGSTQQFIQIDVTPL